MPSSLTELIHRTLLWSTLWLSSINNHDALPTPNLHRTHKAADLDPSLTTELTTVDHNVCWINPKISQGGSRAIRRGCIRLEGVLLTPSPYLGLFQSSIQYNPCSLTLVLSRPPRSRLTSPIGMS